MKDNCNKNCSNCNGTELPNISDTKEINIGYSYAYKTDCAGDRYIKAEEVKYLLECDRNKTIDDFIDMLEAERTQCYNFDDSEHNNPIKCVWWSDIKEVAEQLKAGGSIGTDNQ